MSANFDPVAYASTQGAQAPPPFDPVAYAASVTEPPQEPQQPETVERVAGLGGRALLHGIGSTIDLAEHLMPSEQIGDFITALHHSLKSGKGLGESVKAATLATMPGGSQDVTHLADSASNAMGLPNPKTPGERIGSAAVSALPSAVFSPEAPVAGAVSAALGSGASEAVAEHGGSKAEQVGAGLLAGSLPVFGAGAAAGLRGLARGGEEGRTAMLDTLKSAKDNGVPLTVGQATGNRAIQKAEDISSGFWGGGKIEKVADEQRQLLSGNVDHIVDGLAGGTVPSPTTAGTAIEKGVDAAKANMRAAEKAAYSKVDTLVPKSTPISVQGTLAKLDELASPIPGAENTSAALVSPKIASLRESLQADAAATGSLPYNALSSLRTKIGNAIDWGFAPSNPVENGALKQVYGSLTEDLNNGAAAQSPEASQAVTDARALYAQNQGKRDLLNGVIGKAGGPEAVYQAATNGTRQGATKISGVMDALGPDQQNLVRATVISRLGRATAGAQNAEGTAFSPATFLTNWNLLDPAAKDALFGKSGEPASLRSSLDSLTKTLSTLRNSPAIRNPSGSGKWVAHALGAGNAVTDIMAGIFTGHPMVAAGAVGLPTVNFAIARALTSPRLAEWLARTTKLPASALPNALNQLAAMGKKDPDAAALAKALNGAKK